MDEFKLIQFQDLIEKDPEMKKQFEKLFKKLIPEFALSVYQDGFLNKSDLKSRKALMRKLHWLSEKYKWSESVIIHTDTLSKKAKQFEMKGDYDDAKLYYAIFFEHILNEIVLFFCEKRKLSRKIINEILKNSNIKTKLTWLPIVLGAPKIKEKYVNIILRLCDERNAFIHYKYTPIRLDSNKKDENIDSITSNFKEIKSCVTYFKNYQSRMKYNKNKGHIKKLANVSKLKI